VDGHSWTQTATSPAPSESITGVPHHVDPGGLVSVDGMWPRLVTLAALVVVAAVMLLRPFDRDPGKRSRIVAVVAAFVAVVGELALAPGGAGRLDPNAAALPVMLVTTALAMLPVFDWTRRGRTSGYLAGAVGVLALVLGTEPGAVGELLAGDWSREALRASALAWVAALAWFALATPARPAGVTAVRVVGFAVAVAVVATIPAFTAAGGEEVAADASQITGMIENKIVNSDY